MISKKYSREKNDQDLNGSTIITLFEAYFKR